MKASEIAKLIGVDSRTVRRWTLDGDIPCVREETKGGHYRYADTPALRAWIAEKIEDRKALEAKKKTESKDPRILELCASIKELEKHGKEAARKIIDGVNRARHLGLLLQSWSNKKRLSYEFWRTNLEGKFAFDFDTAKAFVSVASRFPQKVKSFREAYPVWIDLESRIQGHIKPPSAK